ncbi:MAG: VacJ family lipoprotein [Salinisphaera sp.]|jgi:phospholipid-binding lipoprotein MlaA|nr:VacJ family lipoprotein [Salinisphaera sp.]
MPKLIRSFIGLSGLMSLLVLAGCVHSPPSDPWDPLEPINRVTYKFNDQADKYVLRPIAKGYDKITPNRVQKSVSNFFDNASQPIVMVNSLLQLKWGKFNQSLGRFMINTTAGVGGLFDVASMAHVPHPDEDLGQTLGYWGLGPGAYLVLPLLGPSDGRDLVGRAGDHFASPVTYMTNFDEIDHNYSYLPYLLRVLEGVNLRASLLGFDQTLAQQFDPYAFVRSYYLESRQKAVYDGHVPARLDAPDSLGDFPATDAGSSDSTK